MKRSKVIEDMQMGQETIFKCRKGGTCRVTTVTMRGHDIQPSFTLCHKCGTKRAVEIGVTGKLLPRAGSEERKLMPKAGSEESKG
jgi:hypothetical protein